jgi:hypothetical protein
MKSNGFNSFLKNNALQLVGVIVVVLNLWLASKLAPLAQDIALIKTEVYANGEEHKSFVTEAAFNQVVIRLDKISNRVDEVISILLSQK